MGRFLNRFWDENVAGNGLLNNLIAYWPCSEVLGNALDLHVNMLHLTDVNTVMSNPGLVYPLARQYTKENNEYHTRPNDDALLSGGDVDFTLAVWLRLDSKPLMEYFVSKYKNFTPQSIEYGIAYLSSSDKFFFIVGSGSSSKGVVYTNTFGAPNLNVWYLVVAWHDSIAHTINIQVNNGGIDSADTSGAPSDGVAQFRIGNLHSSTTGFPVDGRIGPTMFWKSAPGGGGILSADKRTVLYNSGLGLPYVMMTA
jgi:hypothetical protein